MRRFAVVALCAAAIAVAGCGGGGDRTVSTSGQRPPNIIVIMTDDLGWGDLGSYGQRQIATPNLDRMAAQGVRFTQFYSGSTVCGPSRSVLMTGIGVGRNEIRGNISVPPLGDTPLRDETVTVAEMLHGAGYRTGAVGKWGLGGPGSSGLPTRQGFDDFYGYLGQRQAHNPYPEFLFRGDQRVDLPNETANPRADGTGVAVKRVAYSEDLFRQEALRFIDANRDRPFFLYLPLTIPHANNEADPKDGLEVPTLGRYANRPWPHPEKAYAAMITRMDADVGRILRRLGDLGIDRDTIVFFTSDNGPHSEGGADANFFDSNGPFRGIKRSLLEGGIRVPMIVRWPGHTPAGAVSNHVSYLGDIFATAADIAGAPPPDGLDSISMLPSITGHPARQERHPVLYWEFYEEGTQQAVRMGRWKAYRSPMVTGPIELYDLTTDPGERRDLAAARPALVRRMAAIMASAHVPSATWPAPGE